MCSRERTFAALAGRVSPRLDEGIARDVIRPSALAAVLLLAACLPASSPAPARVTRAVVLSDLNAAYGSTAYDAEVHRAVRETVERWRPDFVMVAGDMIAGQSPRLPDSTVQAMWRAFDAAVQAPLRRADIPLVVTLGNHDGSAYPAHARDRRLALEHWRSPRDAAGLTCCDLGGFPLRYATSFGDVFVVSWDGTRQESATDAELLAWLEGALSSAEARRARHRVVLSHLPLYAVAEGRNRAGEILADGDRLRRQLEQWGATMVVSGHHHAYYPGHRGVLELLHAGALGGGPRPLIGSTTPSPKTATVLDFHPASVSVRTYAVDATGALTLVEPTALPPQLCGVGGGVVRRDRAGREPAC